MSLIDGVNPTNLAEAGWGVIFAENADPAIKGALRQLLEHRRAQATSLHETRYREFSGVSGYRSGDSKLSFLARLGAGPGRADPETVPYYLLLVGDPESIPYHFEEGLGQQYCVGRVHFNALEEYEQYARSVVETEVRGSSNPRSITLFSPRHDIATEHATDYLVKPLAESLAKTGAWEVSTYIEELATKVNLKEILGGRLSPKLALAAGHGLVYKSGSAQQEMLQGALVCQEWTGPGAPVMSEVYFSADDVTDEARLLGMIIILWAEFSIGTDAQRRSLNTESQVASESFAARLPQRLLSHPNGGALAVIGSAGHLWLRSLEDMAHGFEGLLIDLMNGYPIGFAVDRWFRQRYADHVLGIIASKIGDQYLNRSISVSAREWQPDLDNLRMFIFGDPAVRIAASDSVSQEEKTPFSLSDREILPSIQLSRVGALRGAVNDRVADKDQLAFRHYIGTFADLIESPDTDPPLTIGIYGQWGSGKSFLMEHIAKALELRMKDRENAEVAPGGRPKPRIHIVRFNAWEYGSNDLIWPGLVRKIMEHLEGLISRGQYLRMSVSRFWRASKRELRQNKMGFLAVIAAIIASIVALMWADAEHGELIVGALVGLGIGGVIKVLSSSLGHPLSQWVIAQLKRGYGQQIDYMVTIRSDMEWLQEFLAQDNSRILVLIDDLDRCHPRKAVEVLEAIKLLLDFDKFVVCLGVDARIITRAVESYYEGVLGPTGASGYEYLDKIIQIPFLIPNARPSEVEYFLRMQMGDPAPWVDETGLLVDQGESTFDGAPDLMPTLESNRGPVAEGSPETGVEDLSPRSAVSFTYTEFEAFRSLSSFLKPNPRHLKRLVNVYRLVRTLAEYRRESLILRRIDATVRWLVMCSQWPYMSSLMLRDFDDLVRRGALPDSSDNPLLDLLDRVVSDADQWKSRRIDHEPALLRLLLESDEGRLSWEEVRIFRQYTINFNPAVESDLKSDAPEHI